MNYTLTPRTKANRKAIATMLQELAIHHGAQCTIEDAPLHDGKALWVKIASGPARLTIHVGADEGEGYLTPWHMDYESKARYSPAFGSANRAEVNRFHKRKCMGHAATLRALVLNLVACLACISNGNAFLESEQ